MKRALLAAVSALAVLYLADFFALQFRISTGRAPFGQVTVNVLYAVPEKAAKMDFSSGAPETEECVHSLFPHFGDDACWHAERVKLKRVDL